MYIKFSTKESADNWVTHNNLLVGYDGEHGATNSLTEPFEAKDGYIITLAKNRWDGGELAEPLELLDGELVETFERLEVSDEI